MAKNLTMIEHLPNILAHKCQYYHSMPIGTSFNVPNIEGEKWVNDANNLRKSYCLTSSLSLYSFINVLLCIRI